MLLSHAKMRRKLNFLITAGPTREFLDPFRFISNPSSGKMGYAFARAARERGQETVLVSGPTNLPRPEGVKTIRVSSAREMRKAVMKYFPSSDVVIMAAAVSDYRPAARRKSKIKKNRKKIQISLVSNPDILAELGGKKGGRFLVGFSADSDNIVDNARKKMEIKGADLIVANDISSPGSGFESDSNRVVVLERDGKTETWPLLSKDEVAERLIKKIIGKLK